MMRWLFGQPKGQPAPSSPDASDQATLSQLKIAGGDLAKPTEIINYLYVADEERAQAAGRELEAAGYSVEVRPAATGPEWLALAKIELVPSVENIRLLRSRFEDLASRLSGEFDGWEAAVTP